MLISWLKETYGTDVELLFAHGLRQSPDTMPSTTFDVHQDTEDHHLIKYTVQADSGLSRLTSSMRVVGAGKHDVSAGAFLASLVSYADLNAGAPQVGLLLQASCAG